MSETSKLRARVRQWLLSHPMPQDEICRRANIAIGTLHYATKKGWNPRADTLDRLAALVPDDWEPPDEQGAGR